MSHIFGKFSLIFLLGGILFFGGCSLTIESGSDPVNDSIARDLPDFSNQSGDGFDPGDV